MTDPPKRERKEPRSDDKSGSKSESRRREDDSDDDSRNVGRPASERSSRRESRKSTRKESSRSLDDHNASLPQNQFPGQGPSEYTEPYRPPGQAAQYYGDHGESVQSQPGVRPNPPRVIHTADQAHLMQPTTEAKPPPEPSSLGQVGAAAAFFGMGGSADDTTHQSTPSKSGGKASSRPSKSSRYNDDRPSSRRSPGPSGRISGTMATTTIGAAGVGASIGQAAEYYTGNIPISSPDQSVDSPQQGVPPRTESPESYAQSVRPTKGSTVGSQSGSQHYGSAAATGLAGAAAASYLADHTGSHHDQHSQYSVGPSSGFAVGQGQSAFPRMQQQRRQKRRGPLGKLANWFKDPDGVAEFEAYTEAIGVCRHCFDPKSSPADAPRKHHYHSHRRSSGSRYGSTTRVDKTSRYSSSDDDKRRGSAAKKVFAGGLAGYGAAKIGEAAFKQKHDFDDTYSVKSGRPDNRSRVSFKEDDTYTSRVERGDSKGKSRRDGERYEKRASRRRDSSSSSSSQGISRGNALGVAAGATGLAMGAEALHRRQSRNRSRSPSKRKYYSKRVSPRHSYVDLSATSSAQAGLAGFFSPSSNKKGKKPKGLFNFGNASSSSSDADLVFGEGTVKRKPSKKGKGKDNDTNYGSTAAILGLAATGAALAAESDRKQSKGKDRRHANESAGRNPRRSSSGKIRLQDHESTTDGQNDDAWEDASNATSSSNDTALAYGGRASAAQSRESLRGTDKWDWRWEPKKEKRKEKIRRQSSGNFDAAATGLAGAAVGAVASEMMSADLTPKPPLRHLDPISTSDPNLFDAHQPSAFSGISPFSSVAPQERFATSSSVPLQQPQPVLPVGVVPDNFAYLGDEAGYSDRPQATDAGRISQRDLNRKIRSRRDSSPAKLPSRESRGTVSFNVPQTMAEDERKEPDKEPSQRSRRGDKERRKSADSEVLSNIDKEADPKIRRQSSEYDRREAEIEAELQRLYEEERKRKDRQRKQNDRDRKVGVAGVGAAAAAVGAGVAAAVASKRGSSSEDTTPRRKSSMKKGKEREISPQGDTQQERIARMAAQRVRSTPSPVHEDYQTFFVPAEIAEHVKEHNEESAHRDDADPHIVEIVPGALLGKKETFDPFNYRPFGIDPDDDPTVHPWPVPTLDLVEPTPPASRTHSLRSTPNPSPRIEPVERTEQDEEDMGEKLERRSSRITWGDDEISIYEAMTPEWERSDFIPDPSDQVRESMRDVAPPPETGRVRPRSSLNRVYTIDDDDATPMPDVDKASNDLPGGFPTTDSPDRSPPQVDVPPTEEEQVPTPTMDDLNDMLRGSPFYQQRFSEAVSDSVDLDRPEPHTGHGFVEDRELPETPIPETQRAFAGDVENVDTIPTDWDAASGPRLSKSERRRMERAAALEKSAPPASVSEQRTEPSVSIKEVDADGNLMPLASALGLAASTLISDGQQISTDAARDPSSSSSQVTPAEVEEFSKPERSSDMDKKSSGSMWSNIFGGAASDIGTSTEKASKPTSVNEVAGSTTNVNGTQEPSFLAERPEMPQPTDMHIPMATDGVSGLKSVRSSLDQPLGILTPPAPLVAGESTSRAVSAPSRGSQATITDYFTMAPTHPASPASKRVSGLMTTDLPSTPDVGISPTTVPFNTRRFPVSPATPRTSWSSPIATPNSPLAASRTRQGRPKSTEFRSAREFRPLYLVQKSMHEKSPSIATPEVDEDLPSLPSSRTSSAHPSMENLRGEAERQEYFDTHQMTPEQFRERGRRHSASYWRDEPRRRISPDYLDSRSATPVPADFSRSQGLRVKKERPKYEFHSPSELLQDPTMNPELPTDGHDPAGPSSPLPSVVSTDHEDFMSARSGTPTSRDDSPDFERQRSRRRSRSESKARRDTLSVVGLGLGASAAVAVAATEALSKDKASPEETRDVLESSDLYSSDVIPFAAAPPPPPPPPPPSAPTGFTKKILKRAETLPAASVTSADTQSKPKAVNEGGMGSIAAMVAARANQMKENKARKSLPIGTASKPIARALESQKQAPPSVATELTAEPESAAYDEIASAEALIAASRALRGADVEEGSKDITVAEPATRKLAHLGSEVALELPASSHNQAGEPVGESLETQNETIPIARELANSAIDPLAETPAEEADEWAFSTKKSKKDKRKSKNKDISEAPSTQESTEPSTPAEEIDQWAFTPGKKPKKDKKRATRQQSLTPLDISKAEARDEIGERTAVLDDDQPLTAISSEKRSEVGWPEPMQGSDLVVEQALPEAEAVEGALQGRKVSFHDQPAEMGDIRSLVHPEVEVDPTDHWTTERTFGPATGLSEHGNPMLTPKDDNEAVLPLTDDVPRQFGLEHQLPWEGASEEAAAAFVPSAALLGKLSNDLGALEEAFERALRARGLPPGLSRTAALGGFLPTRDNAPFIAKGGLTPIAGSEVSSPADKSPPAEEDEAPRSPAVPKSSQKDKKTSRKLDRKGSSLRQVSLNEEEGDLDRETVLPAIQLTAPSSTDLAQDAAPAEAGVPPPTAQGDRDGPNPFGTDFEVPPEAVEYQPIPSEPPMEPAVEATRALQLNLEDQAFDKGVEPETPLEAAAEDFSSAPVSKKDKKKKKKSQTSTPAETATPSEATPLENPSEPIETSKEAVEDDWATPSAKKSKKGKKDKKRQTLDWADEVASDAGLTAAAIAAGTVIDASAFEDKNIPPTVAEAEELVEATEVEKQELEPAREIDQPLTELDAPSGVAIVEATQPENNADLDDFAAVPTSKKDKKKKKKGKSSTFDWDDASTETSTPGESETVLPADKAVTSMTTKMGDAVLFSVPENVSQTAQDVPIPAEASVGTRTEAADDEWSAPSKKQSKKDKRKGKKGKSIAFADLPDEDSTPQTPAEPEISQNLVEDDGRFPSVVAMDEPPVPEMENKDDLPLLTAIATASAEEHHESEQHQEILDKPLPQVSGFPAKPEDTPAAEGSRALSAADFLPPIESGGAAFDPLSLQERPTTGLEPLTSSDAERTMPVSEELPSYARPEEISTMASEPLEQNQATEEDILFQPSKKSKKEKKKAKKKSVAFDDWDEPSAESAGDAIQREIQPDDTTATLPVPGVERTIKEFVAEDVEKERHDILAPVEALDNSSINEAVAVDVGSERAQVSDPIEESVAADMGEERKDISNPFETLEDTITGAIAADVGTEREKLLAPVDDAENVPIREAVATEVEKEIQEVFEPLEESKRDAVVKVVSTDVAKEREGMLEPVEESKRDAVKEAVSTDVGKGREEISQPVEEPTSFSEAPQKLAETTPAEIPAEEDDQLAWTTGKKSKKDKKKAKKRSFVLAEDVEIASLAPGVENPVEAAIASERDLNAGTPAGAAGAPAAIQVALEADAETPSNEQEHFSFQSISKKSKKDKKMKKNLAWANEEVSTPATQDSDLVPVYEAEAAILPEASTDEYDTMVSARHEFEDPISSAIESATNSPKGSHDVAAAMLYEAQVIETPVEITEMEKVPESAPETVAVPTEIEEPTVAATGLDMQAVEMEAQVAAMEPALDEEPEEFSWAPATKKSKKDKKKKRGSAFDFDSPIEGTSRPEPEAETSARDLIAGEVMTTEPTATEDDWGFTSKKSKKDKKNKRGSTFDFDSPAESTSTPEPEAETTTKDDTIDDVVVATEPTATEDDWGFTSEKGKKDKKKKGRSTLTFNEAIEEAATPGPAWEEAQSARTVEAELEGEQTTTDHATQFAHEVEPPVHQVALEENAASEPEPVASDIPAEQTIAAPFEPVLEDDWGFPNKKGKKGKKKSRASPLALDEPSEPVIPEPEAEAPIQEETAARDVGMEDVPPTSVAEPEEEWGYSTKKGEKDEKKKRASTFALDEPEESSTPVTETLAVETTSEPVVAAETDVTIEDVSVASAAVAVEPEEWAVPARKSKKDKKKKRTSFFGFDEQEETSTPGTETPVIEATVEPEPTAEPEVAVRELAEAEVHAQADPGPAAEPEEWAFSTKKSKKDKKKKRTPTFGFDEQETSTPGTESPMIEAAAEPESTAEPEPAAELEVTTRELNEAEAEALASPAVEPEEWELPTKKSKKDKKKKRGSLLAWDDSTRAESDVPAGIKAADMVEEFEALVPREESEAPAEVVYTPLYTEPNSLAVASEKTMEFEPTLQAFEAPTAPQPAAQSDQAVSEVIDAPPPPQFDLAQETSSTTREAEVEPEAEVEDWGFPMKKSKKDKKKQRGSALAWNEIPAGTPDATSSAVEPEVSEAVPEPDTVAAASVHDSGLMKADAEPEPEAWSFSTKKSKKDKKKRKSVPGGFGDDAESGTTTPATPMEIEPLPDAPRIPEEPMFEEKSRNVDASAVEDALQPTDATTPDTPVTDEPASTADVPTILPETSIENTPEDVWGFSTKKSKKDKKKRQTTLREELVAQDSSSIPTPTEPVVLGPEIAEVMQESQLELDPESLKVESEEATEADAPIDWANDPWGISTKKSKKDKKKRKQAAFDVPVDIASESGILGETDLPRSQSPTAQEKAADLVATAFADDRRERSRSRSRSRDAPATTVEVPTDIGPSEPSSTAEPEILELATPAEAMEEEGWGFSTKKSKKDNKKKRQPTLDELPTELPTETRPMSSSADVAGAMMMEAFSMSEDKDLTVEDQSSSEIVADETQSRRVQSSNLLMPDIETTRIQAAMPRDLPTPVQVKEMDDYEFGRASPISYKASAAEPELTPTQTLQDLKEEQIQPTVERPHAPAEVDDWYAPAAMSKKDKKKKKRQSVVEVEDQYGADVSARTIDENVRPAIVEETAVSGEAAPTEEWTADRKKSKRDKKKKRSQLAWEEEAESTSALPAPVEEPQEPEIYSSMRERSSSLKAAVLPIPEMEDPVQMSGSSFAEERSFPGGVDAGVPSEVPEPPSAASESYEPDRSLYTESVKPTPALEDDWYSTPKKGKKSKKGKKATRASTFEYPTVGETAEQSSSAQRWAAGANDDYMTPAHDTQDVRMDDSDGSRVSESTRERRRRKRSPKAYDGEELPDLPRPLATPPPEHDNIMDTALGVAAGIGFGKSESERAPRPHSPTPTKPTRDEPSWSFENVATAVPRELQEGNRDSGIQFDSPTLGSGHPRATRDSGYVPSPAAGHIWDREARQEDERDYLRPARPQSPTSSTEDVTYDPRHEEPSIRGMFETPARRQPSPIESTTKDRSSVVFKSSPAAPSPHTPHVDASVGRASPSEILRSPSTHDRHLSREQLRSLSPSSQPRHTSDSPASNLIDRGSAASVDRAVFSQPSYSNMSGPLSPPKSPLYPIPEHRQSNDFGSAAALGAAGIGAAALLSRDSASSPASARSLGRSKSQTSSLRDLRGSLTSPTPYDRRDSSSRTANEARASASGEAPATSHSSVRNVQGGGVGGMADVYVCPCSSIDSAWKTPADYDLQNGYGANPGTPTSPSRPPSITRRRSMQQIQDLQAKVDQLASENRLLAEAKIVAERHLEEFHLDRNRAEYATEEALREAELKVRERDDEIAKLTQEVEVMAQQHDEQSRSMGVGAAGAAGLAGAGLTAGAMVGSSWEEDKQELEDLRSQHHELSTGVDEIVRREVDSAVAEKTAEIERLQDDLTVAKQRIKEVQSQILSERSYTGGDSVILFRDEDYFDQKCQELCQHVQGWVLRFSKFSDSRVCRSTNEVRDEKVVDRFDNAILDGSEVDTYLGDRVKRRDVFMSVVMTMIWDYVFTRYLFGMDREQRQKLKQLEKNLGEVGSKGQVGQWRAMTLTLLSKREGFRAQCESDTQAVSIEILGTLSKFLPPPANLQEQILESLRGVLRLAVQVSVEMRCQGAEYIMLPPLQPEYDTNGDLMRKVFFNASLMNERSGETKSNLELQEQGAVVRVVLFPLVVKKGGAEEGEEEEIVVCPAQVLVARVDKGKKVKRSSSGKSRVTSGRSDAAQSTHSLGAMSGVEMGGNVI